MAEVRTFDLTPNPRILPMLGMIVLPPWQCLAEFIDNSVDAFIDAARAGTPIDKPRVVIHLPTNDSESSQIVISDNALGMDADTLEKAAKAGWTSNDPINNLGLFGMGFNIATARLGDQTTIWTTRQGDTEWVGLEINFSKLIAQQSFFTVAKTRPKSDPNISGTEVVIERLKPEQRVWVSRSGNRSQTRKKLGRVYTAMLNEHGRPIGFELEVGGIVVSPRKHCVWGSPGESPSRSVETSKHGTVDAFQPINGKLPPRPYCTQCWNWLAAGQTSCPYCLNTGEVIERERRVHGWLGIQRYLDESDFGIDFIRNGRKIEIANKDLFDWSDEISESIVTEYPIDDPRHRGRIVGEIHLDHCQVPYTKDRFVRQDAAWSEMVDIVRGRGPLRPEIARQAGYGGNNSPLFHLYSAYRRNSPSNKNMAGVWTRVLVVKDNSRASEMAKKFYAGEFDHLSDEKWWDLIEEEDAKLLEGSGGTGPGGTGPGGTGPGGTGPGGTGPGGSGPGGSGPGGSGPGGSGPGGSGPGGSGPEPGTSVTNPPPQIPLPSLSRKYHDDLGGQNFNVNAYSARADDAALEGKPWVLRRTTAGPYNFLVHEGDDVFRSITLTPLDALLAQIAWYIVDFDRGQSGEVDFAQALASLRSRYAGASRLDPTTLIAEAEARLVEIARSIANRLPKEENRSLHDDFSPSTIEALQVTMASRGVLAPQEIIDTGDFLQYAEPATIANFVSDHPELFFDGNFWDAPYATLPYTDAAALETAQRRVLNSYTPLLTDAVWLAANEPDDLCQETRERLMRASLATDMLAPDAAQEEST